ncbi:MAG: CHAT domain-containing protein [Gammaproteobacteria bacterium]
MARPGAGRVLLPLLLLGGFGETSLAQDDLQGRRLEASPAAKSRHPQDVTSARIDRLLQTAAQHQARGRVNEAFALLREAQVLLERSPDKARSALVLGRLSDGYLLERRLEEASGAAEEAVALARKATMPAVLAAALNHLGNVRMAEERYPEAIAAYREGSTLADRSADPDLTASLLTNTVHGHLANATPKQALAAFKSALAKTHSLPLAPSKTLGLIGLGHLAQRLALAIPEERSTLIQSGYQALTQAQALAEATGEVRAKADAVGYLGELAAMEVRYPEAERLFHQALFFAAQAEAPELSARWQWQLGRVLEAQERDQEAVRSYRKALEQFASIRAALVLGQRGYPRAFRATVGAVYLDLAALLLRQASSAASPLQGQVALREVRDVMEKFKAAELQSYFLDECVTALQQRTEAIDLDRLMDPGTAMLYPILFPERTVLLLSVGQGPIKQFETPVATAKLRETLVAFRKQLTGVGNPRRLRQYGLILYEWLISPIVSELEAHSVHTLVISPDDALRTVPFAALYDGREFLISRYAIVVTPGLTLMEPETFARGPHQALLAGLSEGVQGFGPLPNVSDEIKSLASLYEGTQLMNESFVKPRIKAEIERKPYGIIAFATHARIDGDPRKSYLLTYEDRITLDELDRFVRTSQFRDQPVELMVLSACETAEGDERAALGLAGVALKAGARSVMASLWAVSDVSTSRLVGLFFENLKNAKLTKAQALRRAQQQLLADDEYKHPFYWAPFVLIGNWL